MRKDSRKEKLRDKIMKLVERNWPTHIKELVSDLGYEINNLNIKKVAYHVKQLDAIEKIRTKRIGQALVVWPYDVEKLRVIYEMLKEES